MSVGKCHGCNRDKRLWRYCLQTGEFVMACTRCIMDMRAKDNRVPLWE